MDSEKYTNMAIMAQVLSKTPTQMGYESYIAENEANISTFRP